MPTRRPACEPCRNSKLSCDHVRPVCSRCATKNKPSSCIYRSAPFRRHQGSRVATIDNSTRSRTEGEINDNAHHYPNPGYLGNSSHTRIYAQLESCQVESNEQNSTVLNVRSPAIAKSTLREVDTTPGPIFLEQIRRQLNLQRCIDLVENWLLRGSNLALACHFVQPVAQSVRMLFTEKKNSCNDATLSRRLFECSSSGLHFSDAATFDDFLNQTCFENARWEILGLFFTAVSMATIDIVQYPQLYISRSQRQALRKLALNYSDRCLAFSLSLDCLNDLQVILQYENFINHSYSDGDQSFDSWKRLGDIISSIYALGFHEKSRDRDGCPSFLKHIREAVFAFTYSADKNISIFLGRPPRMHYIYCDFTDFDIPSTHAPSNIAQPDTFIGWSPDGSYSFRIEAWWSMMCALQKEEVLAISREKHLDEKKRKAEEINAILEASLSALPIRFRASGKLIDASDIAIERDFVAAARLNHLHVQFLLQLSLSKDMTEMSRGLLTVSLEILTSVNEENLIRDYLVSSGTGLVWRTAYYGLPAAGILCLALLNGAVRNLSQGSMLTRTHHELNVLVAHVIAGAFVDVEEPNYALLMEAAATIKIVVDRALLNPSETSIEAQPSSHDMDGTAITNELETWFPWPGLDSLDFEIPFWTGLAEHYPTFTEGNILQNDVPHV